MRSSTGILIMLLLLLQTERVIGQNTLQSRWLERSSAQHLLLDEGGATGWLRFPLPYASSLTSVLVEADVSHAKKPIFVHQGAGHSFFNLKGNSYLKVNKGLAIWGHTQYSTGKNRAVAWRSTADMDRLYPYFVADSVGGPLSKESYSFGGGVEKWLNHWFVAAELRYDAAQEYRTRDPRPRNITSDFIARLTVGQPVGAYLSALTLGYNQYKQQHSVTFYNERGGIQQWLMNGLGESFRRFDTNKPSLYYRAGAYELGATLSPLTHNQGWFVKGGYKRSTLTRILSGNNETPTNAYTQDALQVLVAYLWEGKGVAATLLNSKRIGKDFVVGPHSAGTYPILEALPQFIYRHQTARLTAIWSHTGKLQTSLLPSVAMENLLIRGLAPSRQIQTTMLEAQMQAQLTWRANQWNYLLASELGYTFPSRKNLALPRALLPEYRINYLEGEYAALVAPRICLSISPVVFCPLPGNTQGIQVKLRYAMEHYKGVATRHQTQLSLALYY